MMRNNLSVSILRAVRDYTAEHKFPPSIRDIKSITDYNSTSGIYGGLRRLEKQGYITREQSKARSVILTRKGKTRILRDKAEARSISLTEKGRSHLDVAERL